MSESDCVNSSFNDESEDDENQEYFLQTTTNSYDIKEKIRVANNELFENYDIYNNIVREQKVTFHENLVDYEPDYSSDDGYVKSPEILLTSDIENDIQNDYFEGYYPLEVDNCEETNEEVTENFTTKSLILNSEINEASLKIDLKPFKGKTLNLLKYEFSTGFDQIDEEIDEEIEIIEITDEINDTDKEIEEQTVSCEEVNDNIKITKSEKTHEDVKSEQIICRLHCLEKKDLDFISESMKNNLNINKGLPLKLRPRTCCQNQQFKPKLPLYNGFVSEYGMSKAQLEKRQRKKERNAQKNKEKMIKIQEQKSQKDLYNEEIFCAWLRSIQERNRRKENITPARNRKNNDSSPKKKQRPKTANEICNNKNNNMNKNKRPSTSPCKNYITTIYVSPGVKVKQILHFDKFKQF